MTGAVNAMRIDRKMSRDDLAPVQVYVDDDFYPVPSMQTWGEYGVSSLAWQPAKPDRLFVSGGDDLRLVDAETGDVRVLPVGDLVDVHEMDAFGDHVWIANTGVDEAVAVDAATGTEAKRIPLRAQESDDSSRARYHANQVFEADGHLHVLVHHVTGRQVVQRVAEKLLKRQGEGGVLNLDTGDYLSLSLSGPHSVRVVGDTRWVFDSGQARLRIYDQEWQQVGEAPTAGWGRGAAISDAGFLLGGSSPIRKRYLDVIPGAKEGPSTVEAFDLETRQAVAATVVPNVEQINNLYVMPRQTALRLIEMDELRVAP